MVEPVVLSAPGLNLHIAILQESLEVRCRGGMTFENSDFVKREVRTRIPEMGRLVLDLSDVNRMDSSGLGAIVALYLSTRSRKCDFEVINFNKQIRDLLSMSNLLSVFEACGRHGIRMP